MLTEQQKRAIHIRDMKIVEKLNRGFDPKALAVEFGVKYSTIAGIKHKYKEGIIKTNE